MGKKKLLISSAIAAFSLAFLWQVLIRDTVFITFGVGRKHQKIEEFPYQCRRLEHPLLESCEDMVLDEESRTLFAACSSVASRRGWSPGGDQFNVSARTLNDHVSVLNIDESGSDVLHGLQKLEISGDYKSATGGMDIDVHGIALEVLSPTRVRLWLNNHRTPVDHAGNALDATKVGANDTIEVFEYTHGSAVLEHVKTIVSDAVFASNNLHPTGHGGVLVTNDHNSKVGKFRKLEMLLGSGNVAYCFLNGTCHLASTSSFNFANGITGLNNTIYVANAAKGYISVHSLSPTNTLTSPSIIPLGIPVDNLSIDSNGDIFAACFPDVLALVANLDGPVTEKRREIPSTVLRIRRVVDEDGEVEYRVEKVLEDIEGRLLPGATTAVHDVKRDAFWLGGVASPFVTVCERIRR